MKVLHSRVVSITPNNAYILGNRLSIFLDSNKKARLVFEKLTIVNDVANELLQKSHFKLRV